LIYPDNLFCINGCWFNKINGLYDEPEKWKCAQIKYGGTGGSPAPPLPEDSFSSVASLKPA